MIEFDVRPRGSQLLVAHLAPQARRPWCLTLDDALDHLAEPCFSQIALNVDVKGRGCESALVADAAPPRPAGALPDLFPVG